MTDEKYCEDEKTEREEPPARIRGEGKTEGGNGSDDDIARERLGEQNTWNGTNEYAQTGLASPGGAHGVGAYGAPRRPAFTWYSGYFV